MSNAMESLYQQLILDHYRTPSHKGFMEPELHDGVIEVHHVNPTCGDEVTMRVQLNSPPADGGDLTLSLIAWEGQGCSISQASTSIMTDLVAEKPLEAVLELTEEFREFITGRGEVTPNEEHLEDAVAFAGVAKYPARVKCALLGWMAMKDAVAQATSAQDELPTPPSQGTSAKEQIHE